MLDSLLKLELNKYLSVLTTEFLESYPDEVQELLFECLTTIPFIKNITSASRKRACDLEKDNKGRVIVDLTNPHIIENADYFRLTALYYMKNDCYTTLKPNSNPHSEYRKFWTEEIRRSREGYIRESDGEWITGLLYWFLNFNPMMVNFIKEGEKRAIRKESFPFFFEGIYWRFHYLEQSKQAGMHSIELAKRGAHPYYEYVYTPKGLRSWGDINIGDLLYGTNGNIVTVTDIPSNQFMDIYKVTLIDGREIYASDDHLWKVLVGSHRFEIIKTTKEMAEDPLFLKNKLYRYAIPNNKGIEYNYLKIPIDAYTLGALLGDGTFRHTSIEFTLQLSDYNEIKKYIPYLMKSCDTSEIHYIVKIPNHKSILDILELSNTTSRTKFIPDIYKHNNRKVRLDILKGLMDTDGWCSKNRSPLITTTSEQLRDDIIEIARSLGYNSRYVTKIGKYKKNNTAINCNKAYTITILGGPELFNLSRKKNIVLANNTTIKNYTSIKKIEYIENTLCKCVTVDSDDNCYLINEFVTTHNCGKSYSLSAIMTHDLELGESAEENKRRTVVLTAYLKEYLKDDKDGTFSKFRPALSFILTNTPFPRLMLKDSPNEMSWQMGYRDEYGRTLGSFNMVLGVSAKDDPDKIRGKRGKILFEEMGAFSGLDALYDTTRRSVEDGGYAFAQMYLIGTANESESDFSSAKKLLQSPKAYNIYPLLNVWDKPKLGSKEFGFFFPAYINRAGCYNKDGVSDVVKALLEILMARYNAKYNNADPNSVLRLIAEDPITPAEAIIKVKAAYFPVALINERILELDSNPRSYDEVLTGDLVLNNGKVTYRPTNEVPIRKWGVDNDTHGCVEIFALPEEDSQGNIPNTRYIGGVDSYDNDLAESCSLYSIFIFDLFTDNIVAEFTGRTDYADEAHEIARKLAIMYNAKIMFESNKKGWYAYFAKMNSTHYLAETPLYLRDLLMIKYLSFGSNKYGINASAAINAYGNDLIRQWLISPRSVELLDETDNPYSTSIPTLYTIKNRALLDELSNFNLVNNFDRISALALVMLYRLEKIILYQGDMSRTKEVEDINYAGNDEFFSTNYDYRFEE